MNILLINHYAGSIYHGMEYRTYYMAREWVRAGHNVVIAAADQSHVRSKKVIIPDGKSYFSEEIDGITYLWFRTLEYSENGVRRAFNMASFLLQLFRYAKFIVHKFAPNIVIASSTYPADIFPAHYIAKLSKAKLIYEIHDLWPLSPMQLGNMSKYHPFILAMQFAEDYCYKHCDAVVSMLPKVHEHVKERGLPIEKLHIVENGICLEEWNNKSSIPEELSSKIEYHKKNGNFTVVYAGQHGIANALSTIINAAHILKDNKVAIYLVGKGPEKDNLKQLSQQLDNKNVFFIDSVAKAAMPNLLSQFDCLYIGLQKQPLFMYGISPNKLIDYMMSGKPVIQAIEAGNDLVKDSGCGISVPAENPEALANAILQMMKLSPEERKAMGYRGQHYVKANHDYKVLGKKFLAIMEKL